MHKDLSIKGITRVIRNCRALSCFTEVAIDRAIFHVLMGISVFV